jgi:rhodanese-related sulfurtransferase
MRTGSILCASAMALMVLAPGAGKAGAQAANILQATVGESAQNTAEVSTEQLRRILADRSALVLDTRSRAEFEAGHIPGAHVFDGSAAAQIATVERLAGGDKSKPLVLYCNGPFCRASKRTADQLVRAGFANVRRYQLGIPIWRALGGPTEIELAGIARIFGIDRTAVFIDARSAEEFARGTLPGVRNLTLENLDATIKRMISGELKDSPLPTDDFNRRIVLIGRDAAQARKLADAMSMRPWHNVAYFPGSFETLAATLGTKQ